ncbi:glycosyltransferase family 2 protein [Sphingopyxis sp.]|uniref:glycosyltransferase family 2 protein n=1 Tax=Sphingopyxis sp. TaxID=1908224 RepID=UPI002615139E|nr:glycosyltransferase family 2 protein [Sphingopyxis sp.]MCW0196972.1 glycosyltransferase [Sphingopyxis sp.]
MKISIITAVWNREGTLGHAIDSLDAQDFADWEHIVQDGGSTDGTLALLAARPDPRRKVLSEKDAGIYDALNRAMARCNGDVIGILHSDDFFADGAVLARVAQRFAVGDVDAVYGDLDYVSAADSARIVRRWTSGDYHPRKLRRGWMPPHPTLFVRREVVERLGGYDTSFQIAADYEAILRWFGKGQLRVGYVPDVLVKMRTGGESNRSLERILRKSREDYRALAMNGIGAVRALVGKNISKIPQFF